MYLYRIAVAEASLLSCAFMPRLVVASKSGSDGASLLLLFDCVCLLTHATMAQLSQFIVSKCGLVPWTSFWL